MNFNKLTVKAQEAIAEAQNLARGAGNPELFIVGGDDQLYSMTFDATGSPLGPYTLTQPGKKSVRHIVSVSGVTGCRTL